MRFLLVLVCIQCIAFSNAVGSLCDEARAPDNRSFVWCWDEPDYTALIHSIRPSLYDASDEVDLARREKLWTLTNRNCGKLTEGIEATFEELIWFKCYIRTDLPMLYISDRIGLRIGDQTLWAREWWTTEGVNECSLVPILSSDYPTTWIEPSRVWRSRRGSIKSWIAFSRTTVGRDGDARSWRPEDVEGLVIESAERDRANNTDQD